MKDHGARWILSGALALGGASSLVACYDYQLCDHTACTTSTGTGGATSSSATMTTSSTTTTTTTTGGTMSTSTGGAECDPAKLQVGDAVDPTCGIFVDSAAPGGGQGTESAPFATLAEALANNPSKLPIYVCATGAGVSESVELKAAEHLIGSVTCGDWKVSATKTPWTSLANSTPLKLSYTTGAIVEGFAITAQAATGTDPTTRQGASSIAVIADSATATLVNVDITAGGGENGGAGMNQSGQAPGRQSASTSFDGNAGDVCGKAPGAAKDFMMCPAGGGTTEGAKGGAGGLLTGSAGDSGAPDPGMGEPNGSGGNGEPSGAGFSCGSSGGNGEFGHDGPPGTAGAAGTGQGELVGSTFVGSAGGPGGNGTIGEGGGGGGGRKGNGSNSCGAGITGPSGGGGGAGGCGGLGGAGGGAGGASIALVSLSAMLTLTNVHLAAGPGGSGGSGGDGQSGGQGGNGANGGGTACKGGDGGAGGDGAGGGGGAGGPSIGLASVGTAPTLDDANITVSMTPATGGAAGAGNIPGNAGGAGATLTKATF